MKKSNSRLNRLSHQCVLLYLRQVVVAVPEEPIIKPPRCPRPTCLLVDYHSLNQAVLRITQALPLRPFVGSCVLVGSFHSVHPQVHLVCCYRPYRSPVDLWQLLHKAWVVRHVSRLRYTVL